MSTYELGMQRATGPCKRTWPSSAARYGTMPRGCKREYRLQCVFQTNTSHIIIYDLNLKAFTRYEALNMMGAICFVHAPLTTTDFGLATVRTFQTLQRHRALRGVSVNARIELDPKDPEAVWGLWQPRNPRQRPRWGWSPPPAPVPAPPPAPAPSPAIPRPNPTPPATAAPTLVPTSSPTSSPPLPPDPNIYNWGLDRTNQQDGALDRNNLQCRSRGKGVTIFVLDTGCRASHQVVGLSSGHDMTAVVHSIFFHYTSSCCLTPFQELRGRATTESVAVDGVAVFENGGQDGHGHGTHCSGIAAGTDDLTCWVPINRSNAGFEQRG